MPHVLYFRHKNGHEYIGESEFAYVQSQPSHIQALTKARIIEGVNVPTAGPNGDLQIVTRFVLRPILFADPTADRVLFTCDDVCYGQSGQPNSAVLSLYQRTINPVPMPQPERHTVTAPAPDPRV